MKLKDCEIGQLVVHQDLGRGKIIGFSHGWSIGVEYERNPYGAGHSCDGMGKMHYCWWESADELAPLVCSSKAEYCNIDYDLNKFIKKKRKSSFKAGLIEGARIMLDCMVLTGFTIKGIDYIKLEDIEYRSKECLKYLQRFH